MRDLLFVAHATAFASLAVGLRAWLSRGSKSVPTPRPRAPEDEERYRALIAELAELERAKARGAVSTASYEARRKPLIEAATQLKRA